MENDQTTQACLEIHSWIQDNLNGREKDTNVNRASAATGCVKKRWYQAQGFEGETLQPRAILVFATGDVVEHVLKYMIEKACVGPNKLYSEVDFGKKIGSFTIQHREFTTYEQETLNIKIQNLEIKGHADGWGKRNSDGQWELIEIKSSASYGYDRFVAGETPDYIKQVHALMLSDKAQNLNVRSARFFYLKKDTSHIFDRLYDYDQDIANTVQKEFLIAAAPKEPEAPYDLVEETYRSKPTGRLVAGYPCSYCPYLERCKPGLQKEYKNGKPIWVLTTKKDGTYD